MQDQCSSKTPTTISVVGLLRKTAHFWSKSTPMFQKDYCTIHNISLFTSWCGVQNNDSRLQKCLIKTTWKCYLKPYLFSIWDKIIFHYITFMTIVQLGAWVGCVGGGERLLCTQILDGSVQLSILISYRIH